jgi:thiol-disulfide isomerase/thioredoxin
MGVTIESLEKYNSINSIDYGDTIVFFKFGADWCIPCEELEKTLNNVPNSLLFNISVDNDDFESFLIEKDIYSIPVTIIKYKNVTHTFQGVKTRPQIEFLIDVMKKQHV